MMHADQVLGSEGRGGDTSASPTTGASHMLHVDKQYVCGCGIVSVRSLQLWPLGGKSSLRRPSLQAGE